MTAPKDWRDVDLADAREDLGELHRTLGYVRGCLMAALAGPKVPRSVALMLRMAQDAMEEHSVRLDNRHRERLERDAQGYGSGPECGGSGKP